MRRCIGEDHQCFELDSVVSFCEEYKIKLDNDPWKNFKQFSCGYQDLPFIILQNPTRKHVFEYEEIKQCPTLEWISDVLEETELTLKDVAVVDICSLFSDDDLDRMDKESVDYQSIWNAVEESYMMVEDMLEWLNPSVVISCHFITLGRCKRIKGRLRTTWIPASNGLARSLCSSEKELRHVLTKRIRIGSTSTLCVYGTHPPRLKFADVMIPELRGAFKDVLLPVWIGSERTKRPVLYHATPTTHTLIPPILTITYKVINIYN